MKVAAFNAKKLGLRKVKNTKVCKYLIEIISQYSIVFILEVADQTGKAMELLLEKLNSTVGGDNYEMVCSSALGRNGYKEKFVCFYRGDEVELTDQHQYEDNQPGDEDAFAREPFILRFHCPTTVAEDLVLIPVHTQPNDAEKELDELYDVVRTMRKNWETPNIMILGDFNAAGSYLSKKKKEELRISSPPFYWLIDDTVDTTTHSNKHTYDRIVVYTKKMEKTIVPKSAKSFNFQREFRLSEEEALSISDHYPVEVELKTAVRQRAQKRSKPADFDGRKTQAAKRKRNEQLLWDQISDSEASDSEASDSEGFDSESAGSEWYDSETSNSQWPNSFIPDETFFHLLDLRKWSQHTSGFQRNVALQFVPSYWRRGQQPVFKPIQYGLKYMPIHYGLGDLDKLLS